MAYDHTEHLPRIALSSINVKGQELFIVARENNDGHECAYVYLITYAAFMAGHVHEAQGDVKLPNGDEEEIFSAELPDETKYLRDMDASEVKAYCERRDRAWEMAKKFAHKLAQTL